MGPRVEIGRTGKSDIQLIGRGVSRQHATILTDAEGNHVLIDMLSTNGTWCSGRRVDRVRLQPGTQFAIDNTAFLFEPAQPFASGAPQPVRVADEQWERRTTVTFEGPRIDTFEDAPQDQPVNQPPPASSASRRTGFHAVRQTGSFAARQTSSFRPLPPEPVASIAPTAPAPPRREPPPASPPRQTIGFRAPGGHSYEGDLVADIALFRKLRVKMLHSGGRLEPDVLEQFAQLDAKLRKKGKRYGQGEFLRFRCAVGATLRIEGDESKHHDVVVMDLGVDGARVRGINFMPHQNALTWLSLPLATGEGTRPAVFTARVASTRGDDIGLAFAGAPRWPTSSGASEQQSTLPRLYIGNKLDREDAS